MTPYSSIRRRAASTLSVGALTLGSALTLSTVVPAAPGDAVELTVLQDSGLANGDIVTVTGSGADPELGYYLSTCVIGTAGPTGPDCAGGPSDQNASIWISNNPSANQPINPDGTFTADLTVTQTGETMNKVPINCDETPCAVTLFADHRNGFGEIAGTPVSFGSASASAGASTESTEDAAPEEVVAESSDDSGSSTAWWIAGGVLVVLVLGGGTVAYSKKS